MACLESIAGIRLVHQESQGGQRWGCGFRVSGRAEHAFSCAAKQYQSRCACNPQGEHACSSKGDCNFLSIRVAYALAERRLLY